MFGKTLFYSKRQTVSNKRKKVKFIIYARIEKNVDTFKSGTVESYIVAFTPINILNFESLTSWINSVVCFFTVCTSGTYVSNGRCVKCQGVCKDGAPCNKTTGKCDNGCSMHRTGTFCEGTFIWKLLLKNEYETHWL